MPEPPPAGFRCLGAEHPGVRFRHLDLDAGSAAPEAATTILTALHTAGESELALREGGLYAKRVTEEHPAPAGTDGIACDVGQCIRAEAVPGKGSQVPDGYRRSIMAEYPDVDMHFFRKDPVISGQVPEKRKCHGHLIRPV